MSNLKKYISNTSWLIFEKFLRIILTLGITIWLARYLGPKEFGVLNYILAFVSLFGILSTLGFDKVLSKQLINDIENKNNIMGSSFYLSLISSLLLIPIMTFSIYILRNDNDNIVYFVVILSFTFLFKSFNVIKYWFETKVEAKYNVFVEGVVIIVSTIIKAILIFSKAPLIYFIYVIFGESVFIAIGFILIYLFKKNKLSTWKFSYNKSIELLKESYPIILSGAVFILFTRIDQIMIGNILDDNAVGVYSAAVKISEGWIFIPAVIATSLFPSLLNARKHNYSLYLSRTQHLLNVIALLGFIVAIFTTIFSPKLIIFIFGNDYSQSAFILTIHIWAMLFNAISIISSRYFLSEGLQIYSFNRALAGLFLNVLLNYFLIPIYGINGAAFATVISQLIAAYLLNYFNPKTREMFFMQTKALLMINSFKSLKYITTLRKFK